MSSTDRVNPSRIGKRWSWSLALPQNQKSGVNLHERLTPLCLFDCYPARTLWHFKNSLAGGCFQMASLDSRELGVLQYRYPCDSAGQRKRNGTYRLFECTDCSQRYIIDKALSGLNVRCIQKTCWLKTVPLNLHPSLTLTEQSGGPRE